MKTLAYRERKLDIANSEYGQFGFNIVAYREVKKQSYIKPILVLGLFALGMVLFTCKVWGGFGCAVMFASALLAKFFHGQEVDNEY